MKLKHSRLQFKTCMVKRHKLGIARSSVSENEDDVKRFNVRYIADCNQLSPAHDIKIERAEGRRTKTENL